MKQWRPSKMVSANRHKLPRQGRRIQALTDKDRVYEAFLRNPEITFDEAKLLAPDKEEITIRNWLHRARKDFRDRRLWQEAHSSPNELRSHVAVNMRDLWNETIARAKADGNRQKHFYAKVRDLGKPYVDGTPRLEINLPKDKAEGLPFQIGNPVPIRLRVAGREYDARLHSTADCPYVWVGSPLRGTGGEPHTPGRVLTDAGFQANDTVRLILDGTVVEVLADSKLPQIAAKDRAAAQLQQEGYYEPKSAQDARKRVIREIAQREGQPGFRRSLIRAYNGQCAVSGCDAVDALEACHIAPYRESQSNRVSNGLLLRADIHTLFDLDLIGIDPDSLRVVLSHRLRMTSYREFDGCRLLVPNDPRLHPDEAALRERWKQFLRCAGAKPLPSRGTVEAVMSSFGAWKMSRKERDRIQRIIEQDR